MFLCIQSNREEVVQQACPEPENIRNSNAVKFEVVHNNEGYIIGYCGLKQIPQLLHTIKGTMWMNHYRNILYSAVV